MKCFTCSTEDHVRTFLIEIHECPGGFMPAGDAVRSTRVHLCHAGIARVQRLIERALTMPTPPQSLYEKTHPK
jgi:hypothetical protein